MSMLKENRTFTSDLLKGFGVTEDAFLDAMTKIGQSESDKPNPEMNFMALKNTVVTSSNWQERESLTPLLAETLKFAVSMILSRRTKNNPVLIGEPLVKLLLLKGLLSGFWVVPDSLKIKPCILLIWDLIAGAKFRANSKKAEGCDERGGSPKDRSFFYR